MSTKTPPAPSRRAYVTVEQLSRLFPYSRSLIYREVRLGKIPHLRLAGRIAIDVREFEEQLRRAGERYAGTDL